MAITIIVSTGRARPNATFVGLVARDKMSESYSTRPLGVSDLFRPLGLIPYADIPLLMRASVALINPSLFEGWSTTVEEAKALGTPMVLSDLRVHREQADGAAILFDPHSPDDLAARLEAFVPASPAERVRTAEEAVVHARGRVEMFAGAFADLIEQAARRER